MKAFYSIIVIIGVIGIILGGRAIYVGQDNIRNAESYASMSYTISNIQSMTNEIASGNFSNRSDSSKKYQELTATQGLEKRYKKKGQTQIIMGVIFAVIGLLLLLFGKAKYRQVKSSPSETKANE